MLSRALIHSMRASCAEPAAMRNRVSEHGKPRLLGGLMLTLMSQVHT
jgi:hypothetical protein